MARHIKTDGTITDVTPSNGTDFTLEELRAFVGGYIELVSSPVGELMIVNEEGKLYDLPINSRATLVYQEWFPHSDDFIVGDALVCSSSEVV